MLDHYSTLDVIVFGGYICLLIVSGFYINRTAKDGKDFFLASQRMPIWVVAISVLATSQSAATFLGGPEQGYRGDLTYLASNIGAVIAAFFVAYILIPRFYAANVFTVYELLQQRFGAQAKQRAGAIYLAGRFLASGSRLYMAAIAIALILFGDIAASSVLASVLLIATVGLLYTVYGGVRSVIYSDVLQCLVYVSAAIAVVIWLCWQIPSDWQGVLHALQYPLDGSTSKLRLFNWQLDFAPIGVFSMASVLTGFVLLNIAAFGLDQDMTQRVLTCKTAAHGAKAMLMSVVLVIPVMLIFLFIGLLLYVFYQRPDVMSASHALDATPAFAGESVTVFMYFVLTEMPAGLKAWVTIGIIAAALSTLNSGLNSMASVMVKDFIEPYLTRRTSPLNPRREVRLGRVMMTVTAVILAAVAGLCYYWQQYTDMPLLQFALSVMVFSYSGLLGVYFTLLFTERGSLMSMTLALIVGFSVPLLLQPYMQNLWKEWLPQLALGFTWQLLLGTLFSMAVCMCGKPTNKVQLDV
ncbi:sodium:solute symporter [Alteromonas sp. ASW11-36]|uniref:Sodium:solute symporter n=1 Tax=Alteromonas arenosi TaxID=3055817 RepID=A0ABT7SZ98_9ALTE|nr:sodium:solute symporter [Alteromonas sp. ASW11-36]MDM7861521.1 sodium:solute symporter [Alteromonas sp. ASW11-36]